jgi:hypothetical protein
MKETAGSRVLVGMSGHEGFRDLEKRYDARLEGEIVSSPAAGISIPCRSGFVGSDWQLPCPPPTALSRHLFAVPFLLPNPAQEGARFHDRRQLVQGLSQVLAELHQPLALFRGDRDSLRQLPRMTSFSTFRYFSW